MKKKYFNRLWYRIFGVFVPSVLSTLMSLGQTNIDMSVSNYSQVNTYVNPVLPGDHPDPTLLKVGDDFYHCGSSFHFTPYLPIYHSKDLVHWEVICRVLPPAKGAWVSDRPSAGIWQGAITYFYGSYWIYFSSGGQWFCKANSPYGPWTDPVQVQTNSKTGNLGYDNSIFVDDDGKPYMLIKDGQKVNRIQALGNDGQLTDTVINMDWINAKLQYSWAEGPVMCKRKGYYYYFPAGDVSGGQYVLRGTVLTADSAKWERLGEFFKPVKDAAAGFRRPNHIAAPLQLADGSWWTIGQSYERYGDDDWYGTGRQTSLYPVIWEGDRPWGMAPTTLPIEKPDLPKSGILWRSVHSDYFEKDTLGLCWHFFNKKDAAHYSLNARKGWIRLTPDSGRTSVVQKETDHYYSAVTRVDFKTTESSGKAGLYLSNGNQQVVVRLYSGFDNEKKIIFQFDSVIHSIPNTLGNIVWLKIERNLHLLTGYCSADGKNWIPIGASINVAIMDKVQPNYNSWVGTSVGLFAEGKAADFNRFVCKDGFSNIPAVGYSNYYGVEKIKDSTDISVTNQSNYGGWFMISGIDLGDKQNAAAILEVTAAATKKTTLEIWLDDLATGKLIATIPVTPTGTASNWKSFRQIVKNVSGHHDVFIKFPAGTNHTVFIKKLCFKRDK